MLNDRWMWAREVLARVKIMADLYLLDRHPHFLGPSIALPTDGKAPGYIIPVHQRVPMPAPVVQALNDLRVLLGPQVDQTPKQHWRVY